uniref:Uncharacterized protein n=1 Tax=viral metagenome TaxID=1070528 RepID=A0A6C0CF71_9ZZZZ
MPAAEALNDRESGIESVLLPYLKHPIQPSSSSSRQDHSPSEYIEAAKNLKTNVADNFKTQIKKGLMKKFVNNPNIAPEKIKTEEDIDNLLNSLSEDKRIKNLSEIADNALRRGKRIADGKKLGITTPIKSAVDSARLGTNIFKLLRKLPEGVTKENVDMFQEYVDEQIDEIAKTDPNVKKLKEAFDKNMKTDENLKKLNEIKNKALENRKVGFSDAFSATRAITDLARSPPVALNDPNMAKAADEAFEKHADKILGDEGKKQADVLKTGFSNLIGVKDVNMNSLKESNDFMDDYVKRVERGEIVTAQDSERFRNLGNDLAYRLKMREPNDTNIKSFADEIIKKHGLIDLSKHDLNEIEGKKLDFTLVAKIFRSILLIITSLCIVMYLIVLLLSIFNVINLFVQIFIGITSIFYNKSTSNKETLSYKVKNILKCTKDNYKYDILNILNEEMASLSVFNLTVYIIYLLMFYIIIYVIYVAISSVPLSKNEKYTLIGSINDIDDNQYSLLGVTAVIFAFSIIHLLYYKFLFKSISYKQYQNVNGFEETIDNLIGNVIKNDNDSFDTSFFTVLKDSSKRKQIDNIITSELSDLDASNANNNNLYSYLLIYDIYMYLEHNTYLNDVKKAEVQDYFDKLMQGSTPNNTFISFLDTNERKLIKPYHEELPFYRSIPQDKIEFFETINENIATTISSINKNIISYTGTFNAFLFTSIYVITICIYNLISVYIIMIMVINAGPTVFHEYIVWIADMYVKTINMIYNYFISTSIK